MATAVSIWLALILGASACLKARRVDQAATALATYGVRSGRAQRLAVWALISVELALAGALVVAASWAPGAVAGLFLAFAAFTLAALSAGRGGRPCACFGSASRLSWLAPSRAAALALLAGVMALVAAESTIGLRSMDEQADAPTWAQAEVPGSPYAVAMNLEGVVLAKGTFNSLGQLESILSTARMREQGLSLVA